MTTYSKRGALLIMRLHKFSSDSLFRKEYLCNPIPASRRVPRDRDRFSRGGGNCLELGSRAELLLGSP